jgi:hypothetical protein
VNQQEHEEIAELLLEVYANREPVEPLAAKFAGLTVDDAYEIQLLQVRRWLAGGAQVKGHKVGLTSAAMQRQLGVDQPGYGHLLDRMFWLEYTVGKPVGPRWPRRLVSGRAASASGSQLRDRKTQTQRGHPTATWGASRFRGPTA